VLRNEIATLTNNPRIFLKKFFQFIFSRHERLLSIQITYFRRLACYFERADCTSYVMAVDYNLRSARSIVVAFPEGVLVVSRFP